MKSERHEVIFYTLDELDKDHIEVILYCMRNYDITNALYRAKADEIANELKKWL